MTPSLYIGLMSGTSMDGIDAGLFDLRDRRCATIATHSTPYPGALRTRLLEASRNPDRCTIDEIGELDTWTGREFARAAEELIASSKADRGRIRAIGSHGQTLRHRPRAAHPFTMQIGDANVIAATTGITTVTDFRRRDLALGGEGAPLATAFHGQFLADVKEARVVLNIGGIANITVLPAGGGTVCGFDTGPGNTLLDAWIQAKKNLPCDLDGRWANTGRKDEALLARLRDDPYFGAPPPKSTGFEYFNLRWLEGRLSPSRGRHAPADADVQATLVTFTVATIADAIRAHAPQTRRVLVCGGGVNNPLLMHGLTEALPEARIESTAACGVEPGWVEAATFAWLAQRRLDELPGNLPSVTGASSEAVLGAVYYGAGQCL